MCTQGRKYKEALANKKKKIRTNYSRSSVSCAQQENEFVARLLFWPQFMVQLNHWRCFPCSILNSLLFQVSIVWPAQWGQPSEEVSSPATPTDLHLQWSNPMNLASAQVAEVT